MSAENGDDLGWKNLFRLFHLFSGTFLLFLISPLSFLLVLKATDPWRLVFIVGDILYHALRYTMFVCEKHIESFSHIQAIIGRWYNLLTMVLNLAHQRSVVHSFFFLFSHAVG